MDIINKQIFKSVVGQDRTIKRLQDMVTAGRVPNSLLFVGAAGVGKKKAAMGFAQALLCEKSPMACGQCAPCLKVSKGANENLIIMEPEKDVIKIDAARELIRQVSLTGWGKKRVVIIDQAQQLNPQAANALLKSIEEPPEGTHFVLISPSAESVLKTIRSRSQIVRFASLSRAEFKKSSTDSDEDAALIAQYFELWRSLILCDELLLQNIRDADLDKQKALEMLFAWIEFSRDLWFCKKNIEGVIHEQFFKLYSEQRATSFAKLAELTDRCLIAQTDIKGNCDWQLTLEKLVLEFINNSSKSESFYELD